MTDTPLTAADLSALLAWKRGEILEWPLMARDGEPLDAILLATCAALTTRAENAEARVAELEAALGDVQAIQSEYDGKPQLIPVAGWAAIRERLQHADVLAALEGK